MPNSNIFVKDIKNKRAYQTLKEKNFIIPAKHADIYPHLTFKISKVSDYLEVVNLLSKTKYENFVNGEIIYRGMADSSWKLLPSLGRIDNLGENQERNLVNNFLVLRPEAFTNLNTNFEILSKMQHYELPTRLLDFTSNPLIALFFACSDLINKKDARIVCHRAFVEISKNPIIESVCSFYESSSQEDLFLDELEVSPQSYLRRIYLNKSDRLLIARPSYWNERIQRQSAIFMIFPNRLVDRYSLWAYGGKELYDRFWDSYEIELTAVSNEPLNKIYNFSNFKNPFADRTQHVTHNSLNKLFSYYKDTETFNNWDIPFKNRFQFDCEIEEIDMKTIKDEFCSIIIDKKDKSHILEQLQAIGIDESFVYPELQYTARKVKNMYIN